MYVKGLFEVFKILGRIGIKPKDVIGMGGNIVKMGKSLFNTRINPKLITFWNSSIFWPLPPPLPFN